MTPAARAYTHRPSKFLCIAILNSDRLVLLYRTRKKLSIAIQGLLLLNIALFVAFLLIISFLVAIVPLPNPFHELESCVEPLRAPIPRRIHQTWKTATLPVEWRAYQQRCQQLNPSYQYTLWTDEDIERLLIDHYPWLLALYRSYPYAISRADVARYVILHHVGGVYIDIDVDCYEPFDTLLADSPAAMETQVLAVNPFGLTNYFLVAKQGSDFLRFLLAGLSEARGWYGVHYMTVIMSTGPVYVYNRYLHYPCPDRVKVIPLQVFQQSLYHGNQNSWMYWDGKAAVWMAKHYPLSRNLFYFSLIVTVTWCVLKCRNYFTRQPNPVRLHHI